MTFKFQITDAMEIFKDPIGHYHHWTVLVGRLVEGAIHLADLMCIPAVDGTKMGARVGGFDAYRRRFGSELSSKHDTDPLGVMVWSPAPSRKEIAMGVATSSSLMEFHEFAGWALQHRPARLLHDRGPERRGVPCPECMRVLFSDGPVLHAEFEPILRDLRYSSDSYIARTAHDIIEKSMSAEEYRQLKEQKIQKSARSTMFGWNFLKRK